MYTKKVLKETDFNDAKETVVKITRDDKKMISPEEVKTIVTGLEKKASKEGKDYKLRVRALNIDKWYTLKGYGDDELKISSVDEYLEGKVKETDKFGEFYMIELTMFK